MRLIPITSFDHNDIIIIRYIHNNCAMRRYFLQLVQSRAISTDKKNTKMINSVFLLFCIFPFRKLLTSWLSDVTNLISSFYQSLFIKFFFPQNSVFNTASHVLKFFTFSPTRICDRKAKISYYFPRIFKTINSFCKHEF